MSIFFLFFFLSGFCSLLYQVVWLRVAMAGFGVTTPLVSIVLSIFMAGLALGSWAGGRLVRRLEHRPAGFFIALYGAIELVIGISGLTVAPLLRAGRTVLAGQNASWDSAGYYLVSAAWIGVVMLPFCTCMGATFPLAMAGIRAAFRARSSTSFSYLYLANVLGAMAGAVGSAFVFIELLGFAKTLLIAVALNAVIAATAFAVAVARRRASGDSASEAVPVAGSDQSAGEAADSARSSPAALPLLFTSGLASLGMEVVWTRQFIPIMGPVVYSFAAILAVYLGATALGSNRYRKRIQRASSKGAGLSVGVAATLAGACAFLPLLATDPRLSAYATSNPVLLLLCGIGPFCAVVGFMTPMLVDRWSLGNPNRAGRAYAVNGVGCILGPLLAGFVLLPAVGERWTLLLLALPLFGFGVWFLAAKGLQGEPRPALGRLLAAAAVAAVLLVTLTRDFESLHPGARVRRDYTATSIATGQGMGRRLFVNGTGMTLLTATTKMMSHLTLASLPAPPRNVLVLCFGMGTSFRSAMSWDVPVTVVELVPSVPLLFSYFHADADQLLRSPHAIVVIDDARRYLERTRDSFDAIVIDPPPPVPAAGSSLLYSTEFYALARSHLRPGGILQQWLPSSDATVRSAFAQSLLHSFQDVRVLGAVDGWGDHFLASDTPMNRLPAEALAARLPSAAVRDLVEWGHGASAYSYFATVLSRERPVHDVIHDDPAAPLLTDDRPVNEYFLLRTIGASKSRGGRLADKQ
ncbi:MAG: fused MFS/spermidine synthase [Bryobacteraceae bacterium]